MGARASVERAWSENVRVEKRNCAHQTSTTHWPPHAGHAPGMCSARAASCSLSHARARPRSPPPFFGPGAPAPPLAPPRHAAEPLAPLPAPAWLLLAPLPGGQPRSTQRGCWRKWCCTARQARPRLSTSRGWRRNLAAWASTCRWRHAVVHEADGLRMWCMRQKGLRGMWRDAHVGVDMHKQGQNNVAEVTRPLLAAATSLRLRAPRAAGPARRSSLPHRRCRWRRRSAPASRRARRVELVGSNGGRGPESGRSFVGSVFWIGSNQKTVDPSRSWPDRCTSCY